MKLFEHLSRKKLAQNIRLIKFNYTPRIQFIPTRYKLSDLVKLDETRSRSTNFQRPVKPPYPTSPSLIPTLKSNPRKRPPPPCNHLLSLALKTVIPTSSYVPANFDKVSFSRGYDPMGRRRESWQVDGKGSRDLLLHMPPVQFATLVSLPWQGRPPWLGGGSSQDLLLVCVQSVPHTDHADHLDHPPSTTVRSPGKEKRGERFEGSSFFRGAVKGDSTLKRR